MRSEEPWDAASIEGLSVDMVSDIRVDPDAPMLSFHHEGAPRSYWIDAQGIDALRVAADRAAPIVELRLDGGEGQMQSVLLALRERRGVGHWGAARLIRLDRFAVADDGAAFRSFLVQVSAVLADLQHDLRQPLTAISLAAHNGPELLQQGLAGEAAAKFARIIEQVDSCEARIQQRMARFRAEAPEGVVLPFILAVHAAISPVRRWMEDGRTTMIVSGSLPSGTVRIIPGTLEILLRYILKRSIEAAQTRRTMRIVDIVLGEEPAALRVTIRYPADAGEGDARGDDVALAFARRMMAQIGGEIVVPTADERREGLAATLLFPRYEAAAAADQLAFASSFR